ncbi:MAG: AAA family ATPase, partial [Burkholderiaceae bacterium]
MQVSQLGLFTMHTRAIAPAIAPGIAPQLRLIGEATCIDANGHAHALEPKDALLLAYVVLAGPTPRRALAALLWPDVEPARANANLRQRLYRLRKAVGAELLQGGAVASLSAGVRADMTESALGSGTGELLTGVAGAEAGALADWLAAARESRRAKRIESLGQFASEQEAAGQLASALASARELVEIDPTSEHAHRRLMRLHYLRGDRAAALAAFDRCCDVLEQLLGVAPEAETEALRRHVETAERAPLAAGLPHPLPVSVLRPPRLIGRIDELGVLAGAWQASRPATVIGEAGLGKTRLLEAFVEARPEAVCTAARPGDSAVPFTTLARLLRAVLQRGEAGTALSLPMRLEVACVLPEWGEPVSRDRDGQGLSFQLAVRALLASAPGLKGLVIDDLHFADPSSLQILQSLVDSGDAGRAPLSWVLAYRPAETGSPLSAFQDALLDVAVPARVILAPLDAGQIVQWVDSLELPGVRGAEVAARLLRRTGGNPLFMLETVKQAWLDGALS